MRDTSWTAFDAEHVCYVIQPESGGAFKVGNATCISKRLPGIQSGHPDVLVVRALFRGGATTEKELHALVHEYRRMGEWFDATAVPLVCDFIRRDARLLWGTPWTEGVYREPGPTAAEVRVKIRGALASPKVIGALQECLSDPKNPAYRDALRLVEKYGWIPKGSHG